MEKFAGEIKSQLNSNNCNVILNASCDSLRNEVWMHDDFLNFTSDRRTIILMNNPTGDVDIPWVEPFNTVTSGENVLRTQY